jgi:hypothetical protein
MYPMYEKLLNINLQQVEDYRVQFMKCYYNVACVNTNDFFSPFRVRSMTCFNR